MLGLMRTDAQMVPGHVAVMAQDLVFGREVVLNDKSRQFVCPDAFPVFVAPAIHVVDRQEGPLGFSAAVTRISVVLQHGVSLFFASFPLALRSALSGLFVIVQVNTCAGVAVCFAKIKHAKVFNLFANRTAPAPFLNQFSVFAPLNPRRVFSISLSLSFCAITMKALRKRVRSVVARGSFNFALATDSSIHA